MKTPCLAQCKNNEGICQGCHRTMKEIVSWADYSEQEREQILKNLSGHNTTHTCPECGEPAQCDISAGKSHCWCFDIETREVDSNANDLCLCRRCLEKKPIA